MGDAARCIVDRLTLGARRHGPGREGLHPRLRHRRDRWAARRARSPSGKFNHSDPDWSADGQTIYVSAIRKPDAEYLRGDSEIYAIDLEERSQVKTLTDRKGPDSNPTVVARRQAGSPTPATTKGLHQPPVVACI